MCYLLKIYRIHFENEINTVWRSEFNFTRINHITYIVSLIYWIQILEAQVDYKLEIVSHVSVRLLIFCGVPLFTNKTIKSFVDNDMTLLSKLITCDWLHRQFGWKSHVIKIKYIITLCIYIWFLFADNVRGRFKLRKLYL